MITKFEFATASKVIFGNGTVNEVIKNAKSLNLVGQKALVIVGGDEKRAGPILEQLKSQKIAFSIHRIPSDEPTTESVDSAAAAAREAKSDFVISFGGGSVIDTGKAVAMLLTNGGVALDYMEVIGKGLPITKPSLPMIAISTTAGSGAEVTRNAVVNSVKHLQKASLRSNFMYPALAVVDPELTISVPPAVTAATGLDAFTQCLEPLVSVSSTPLTDAIALKGLEYGARGLRAAYHNGSDAEARNNMALCSLLGGLALANAKLGCVHGFAGVLGGLLKARHGDICAALIAPGIRVNVKALQRADAKTRTLFMRKYKQAAEAVLGRSDAGVEVTDNRYFFKKIFSCY
jgi:alcohol dehydrogenase class IV